MSNLVMLCAAHHRQIHSTEWIVRIRDGLISHRDPGRPWVRNELAIGIDELCVDRVERR